VIAVDEVNVGVAGRSEQDRITRGFASGGVGCGVVLPEICFYFDDAGCQTQLSAVSHQHFAEKLASYALWTAGEEGTRERADGPKWRMGWQDH
jgi:hypothetical protein